MRPTRATTAPGATPPRRQPPPRSAGSLGTRAVVERGTRPRPSRSLATSSSRVRNGAHGISRRPRRPAPHLPGGGHWPDAREASETGQSSRGAPGPRPRYHWPHRAAGSGTGARNDRPAADPRRRSPAASFLPGGGHRPEAPEASEPGRGRKKPPGPALRDRSPHPAAGPGQQGQGTAARGNAPAPGPRRNDARRHSSPAVVAAPKRRRPQDRAAVEGSPRGPALRDRSPHPAAGPGQQGQGTAARGNAPRRNDARRHSSPAVAAAPKRRKPQNRAVVERCTRPPPSRSLATSSSRVRNGARRKTPAPNPRRSGARRHSSPAAVTAPRS